MDNYKRELLKGLTQPFILRRTKEQVLGDLPDKVNYLHPVHLSVNEMAVYEEARRGLNSSTRREKPPRKGHLHGISRWSSLRS